MANAAQREGWDGPGGAFWASWIDRFDEGIARYQPGLVAAAVRGLDPAGAVLDVGCGAGRTTLDVARHAGSAVGVDLSAELLAIARARAAAEGAANVEFRQADAQTDPLGEGFDLVVSRNGVMFFDDPVVAFTALARALRPGGRMVLQTWRDVAANEWLHRPLTILADGGPVAVPPTDGPGMLALSEPEVVHRVLGAAGLREVRLTAVTEPMVPGRDADDAFAYLTDLHRDRIAELADADRPRVLAALRRDVAAHATAEGVLYDSGVWLIEARV